MADRDIAYVVAVRSDVTVHPHHVALVAPPWSDNAHLLAAAHAQTGVTPLVRNP
ncbi:hypothetical protein ACFTY7_05555 [Streptomyces sp. NPDC057062]|uniref:transposase n=1 Tax=unclassified Streptomyces TaxID=2593676 RepID=UPI001C6E4E17|nr:transposase [Streptomyces sp. MBT84]